MWFKGERMISIVIPHRKGELCNITLKTLQTQTYKDFETIVIEDTEGRGPNWARNQGILCANGEYLLMSDADIHWYSDALFTLLATLDYYPHCSYSYGQYEMGGKIYCKRDFNTDALRQGNFISTMSLIRRKDFPESGFDENIKRLQDWDLWLTMLEQGKIGVNCNKILFSTAIREGISCGKTIPKEGYEEAIRIVKTKHGLL